MTVHVLRPRRIERVWGRYDLPDWAPGDDLGGVPVGEIWFEDPDGVDHELLVKLLFTAERLSIQVHPGDAAARGIGLKRGKDEAWLVLDAEPNAVIGLGLRHEVGKEALRAAALSGEIEDLIDWKPVEIGQVYYSPAGTVHAIGAGLMIMEIQQNLDLTYRLYDYGRPRELHLDAAVAAADPRPWSNDETVRSLGPGRDLLHAGGAFVLERWRGDTLQRIVTDDVLVIPVEDGGRVAGISLKLGSVLRVEGEARLEGQRHVIAAYPGGTPRLDLFR